MRKKLEYIKTIQGVDYYLYKPRLGQWYYNDYPTYKKMTVSHFFRMLLEYLEGGYAVYYMFVEKKIVGYILVARGGRRLKCTTQDDIVLGPIWLSPEERGKGIGTKGIHAILNDMDLEYTAAYEFIKAGNIASIRTVEKNGFLCIGMGKQRGVLKRIKLVDEDGDYKIYKFVKQGVSA